MADFFPPDDGNGAAISSDPRAEACYTVHGQVVAGDLLELQLSSRRQRSGLLEKTAALEMDSVALYPAEVPPLPKPRLPQAPPPKSPVNRLFSVPRMSRTINPTAEAMNRENLTVGAQSEGNRSNPAAGGTSSPRGSDASHIELSLRPLTTESQVKDRIEEEVEEGMDASTSTEPEPSEKKNGGFEAVLVPEERLPPQASEQEVMTIGLSSTSEPTALQEAPEKEGKEEEEAPAPHLAAEKEPVVPQLPEEEETVVPLSVPDEEQEATPLPPAKKHLVPQSLSENEEKIPQLPPETEPSLPGLPLEMEPSVPQPPPQKDQKAPQMPPEKEPPVPQSLPESEQNVPQPPVEREPPLPHLLLKREAPVTHPQVFKAPSLLQTTAEMEQPFPHPQAFKESPLPQPAEMEPQAFTEPPVLQTPVEVEPPVPQPLKKAPAPPLPPLQEPIASWPPAVKELLPLQSLPEKLEAVNEHMALQGTSPYRFERPTFQEEKGTRIRSETKARPGREDISASTLASPKPKPAAEPPGGKVASLNDTMEDLASHLREVGNASKSAMASSISSFVASPVGQVFAHTIDRALDKSEEWLDYYLPVLETDEESSATAEEEHAAASEDLCKEGCFVRINSLSTKLRSRAFRLALHQLKMTRQAVRENLPVLDQILDVLDRTRGQNLLNIASIPESLQNLWAPKGPKQEPPKSTKTSRMSSREAPSIVPEQLELKALDLTRTLAQQLYGTYHDLLPHVADLPAHLQEKAIRIYENMEELQSHFTSSPSLRNLPSSLVIQSRQKMAVARENLDEILDFLAQKPAANWLSPAASSSKGKRPTPAAAESQPKGRSPEGKAMEENSTSRQPPSLPRL